MIDFRDLCAFVLIFRHCDNFIKGLAVESSGLKSSLNIHILIDLHYTTIIPHITTNGFGFRLLLFGNYINKF